jgi:hypothetical protein
MKLKPCPFCGGIAAFREIPSVDDVPNAGGQHIECCWCGASTQLRFACGDDPKPLLAESWNRRTDQPEAVLTDKMDCGNCHMCLAGKRHPDMPAFLITSTRMIVCPTCGCKRCPKASDHRLACTDSNEPGQPGSIYRAADQQSGGVING